MLKTMLNPRSGSSSTPSTPSDTPISSWGLSESSGTTANDLFSVNDGTYVGVSGITYGVVSPRTGNAISLSGAIGTYINLGDSASYRINAGTYALWMKTSDGGSGFRAIMSKEGSFTMYINDGVLTFYDWNTATIEATTLNLEDDEWHHLAFAYTDAASSNFYLDGCLVYSLSYDVANHNNPLLIGRETLTTNLNIVASIDDIQFFNSHLTLEELKSSSYEL